MIKRKSRILLKLIKLILFSLYTNTNTNPLISHAYSKCVSARKSPNYKLSLYIRRLTNGKRKQQKRQEKKWEAATSLNKTETKMCVFGARVVKKIAWVQNGLRKLCRYLFGERIFCTHLKWCTWSLWTGPSFVFHIFCSSNFYLFSLMKFSSFSLTCVFFEFFPFFVCALYFLYVYSKKRRTKKAKAMEQKKMNAKEW